MDPHVAQAMLEADPVTIPQLQAQLAARCKATRELLTLLPAFPRHQRQLCPTQHIECSLRCQA